MDDVTMDLSRPRVGQVDRWVRFVILLALAATVAVLAVAPRVLWAQDRSTLHLPKFWFNNTLVLVFLTTLVVAVAIPGRSSRYVRLAVLLPVVQIALMLLAWFAWQVLRVRMPTAADDTPLFEKMPVRLVLPWLAAAVGAGAWFVARPRRREWLHAVVMIGLVNLLLLGLWLPIAANAYNSHGWGAWDDIERTLASPARLVMFMTVPPFLAATLFTATALRYPGVWRRNSGVVAAIVLLALVIAVACRQDVGQVGAYIYVNFIHVIAASGLLAVGSLVTLGAVSWIANTRGRSVLERERTLIGTVCTDEDFVATIDLTSWLRGPRPTCNAFTVMTVFGEVPVPAGANVVTATPLATTLLRRGEAIPTLHKGEHVTLAGYVPAKAGSPFRDSSAPVPGTDGVTVGRVPDERYGLRHAALDVWRPSVAYLVICVAVALPGLAALLSHRF